MIDFDGFDGEDLACAGLRRADCPSFFHEPGELAAALQRACERPKAKRERKPSLASVSKQARKAGVEVARYEIRPDGTVVVVTGTPEPSTVSNAWLDDLKAMKQ